MASRNDRRVVLVVERSRAEINKPDLGVQQNLAMSRLSASNCRGRRHGPVICERLVIVVHQKDVFWFQVGVNQIKVVEEGNAGEELLGELLDMGAREGYKLIRLKEVENTLTVKIGNNADVVPEVKAVSEVDAPIHVVLVVGLEGRQHPQFDARGFPILGYRTNDFDGTLCSF